MTQSEIALELVKAFIDKATPNAMMAGLPNSATGEQAAQTAGKNLGILFDTVYQEVVKSLSQ